MKNLKAISQWLNKDVKPSTLDNTFIPLERLKIAKTIYPDGKKRMSLNGVDEWHGMQEGNNLLIAKKMSNKTIINFILFALILSYGAVGYFLLKEKLQKDSEKQIIFLKKQYNFEEPKDWNEENLTREQHQFYQYLQYAKPE